MFAQISGCGRRREVTPVDDEILDIIEEDSSSFSGSDVQESMGKKAERDEAISIINDSESYLLPGFSAILPESC